MGGSCTYLTNSEIIIGQTRNESLESNGSISLADLFGGTADGDCFSSLTIEGLAFALARGGWPASVLDDDREALKQVYDYVEAVINYDISEVDGVEKSPARVCALMRSKATIRTSVEVKMGAKEIEVAAENLKKLRDKVNVDKMKEPSFLMVLTAGEIGYRRDDGVYVTPIGCLKE